MVRLIVSLLFMVASLGATTITSVTFEGGPSDPTILVTGTGFLPLPATDGKAYPSGTYSGYDYGRELYLYDISAVWDAGCGTSVATGCHDFIGFDHLLYTDTTISMTYGSEYTPYFNANIFKLSAGDQYLLHVHDATYGGTVSFVPEPASWTMLAGALGLALIAAKLRAASV